MRELFRKLWEFFKRVFHRTRKVLTPKWSGVTIYRLVKITAGRHHAWFDSSAGLIRKPYETGS